MISSWRHITIVCLRMRMLCFNKNACVMWSDIYSKTSSRTQFIIRGFGQLQRVDFHHHTHTANTFLILSIYQNVLCTKRANGVHSRKSWMQNLYMCVCVCVVYLLRSSWAFGSVMCVMWMYETPRRIIGRSQSEPHIHIQIFHTLHTPTTHHTHFKRTWRARTSKITNTASHAMHPIHPSTMLDSHLRKRRWWYC